MGALVNVSVTKNDSMLGLDEYESDEALAAVELFIGYPDALLTFASLCCMLFMVVGVPGNLITIIALARCKKVRNATAIFIISLSLSDLLFCCFNLPLAASTFWNQSWRHGKTLCRMFPLTKYALVAISLFTVLAITINRYIMIAWPRLYPKLYSKPYLATMIATIWVFCFAVLVPTWQEKWGRFSLNPMVGSCTIIPDVNDNSPKKAMFIGAFLLPGIAIIVCYARIFLIVKKIAKRSRRPIRIRRPKTEIVAGTSTDFESTTLPSQTTETSSPPQRNTCHAFNCLMPEISSNSGLDHSTTEDRDKKITDSNKCLSRSNIALQKIRMACTPALRQPRAPKLLPSKKDKKLRTLIMAIVLSFAICYLPISITKIFLEFTFHPIVKIISYILLYLTNCINPIIYVVMSVEYRQAYKNLITCRSDQDFPESSILRRIASSKTLTAVRMSRRKPNTVNNPTPT
ncbi:G-protein coupled receptor moody-like [Ostrinia furnacalis]|uniref:G-protein coupled receptor moody-like n=1 Tax=Ostrinia furnacalis TaxID=93504 RepID=UPI00103F6CCA|nr:G-protein coupled receptor moody-like [Ostrinia furnacalis]